MTAFPGQSCADLVMMPAGRSQASMRTAEDVFLDFWGRRRGILKALTSEASGCSPVVARPLAFATGSGLLGSLTK